MSTTPRSADWSYNEQFNSIENEKMGLGITGMKGACFELNRLTEHTASLQAELDVCVSLRKQFSHLVSEYKQEVISLQAENKRLREKIGDLFLYVENDFTLVNGFRTKDILKALKELIKETTNQQEEKR